MRVTVRVNGYVSRYFRQILRMFFISVLFTCVSFFVISISLVTPVLDKTRDDGYRELDEQSANIEGEYDLNIESDSGKTRGQSVDVRGLRLVQIGGQDGKISERSEKFPFEYDHPSDDEDTKIESRSETRNIDQPKVLVTQPIGLVTQPIGLVTQPIGLQRISSTSRAVDAESNVEEILDKMLNKTKNAIEKISIKTSRNKLSKDFMKVWHGNVKTKNDVYYMKKRNGNVKKTLDRRSNKSRNEKISIKTTQNKLSKDFMKVMPANVERKKDMYYMRQQTGNEDKKNSGQLLNSKNSLSMQMNTFEPSRTFTVWNDSRVNTCDNRMSIYSSQFARLSDVTVDRRLCSASAKGGEDVIDVLSQNESSEFYTMKKGCFRLSCRNSLPFYVFLGPRNYLSDWFKSIDPNDTSVLSADKSAPSADTSALSADVSVFRTFTIAIARADYANLYWSMNDWYAAYLMMSFFNRTADSTNILLVDAHPGGKLDSIWSTVFNSSTMFSQLPLKSVFADMVWGLQGYNTVLKQNLRNGQIPYALEDFRMFFLSRFGLDSDRPVDCKRLNVLFLWRRDYVAHPRNPNGTVQRKITNEKELIESIQEMHPTYQVTGVQMDQLSMADQLKAIVDADVFVGMHGAGLAHVLMLQKHAVMIELFPGYYCGENNHFAYLARYSGVSYLKWKNVDVDNEKSNFSTVIPLDVMNNLLESAVQHICGKNGTSRDSGNGANRKTPLYVMNNYQGKMNVPAPAAKVKEVNTALCRRKVPNRSLKLRNGKRAASATKLLFKRG